MCWACEPMLTAGAAPLSIPGQWKLTNSWHLLCTTNWHTMYVKIINSVALIGNWNLPWHWKPCLPNPLEIKSLIGDDGVVDETGDKVISMVGKIVLSRRSWLGL